MPVNSVSGTYSTQVNTLICWDVALACGSWYESRSFETTSVVHRLFATQRPTIVVAGFQYPTVFACSVYFDSSVDGDPQPCY